MKQNRYFILAVIAGIILLISGLFGLNSGEFPEERFASEATLFSRTFDRFLSEIATGVEHISSDLSDSINEYNPGQDRAYLFDFLKNNTLYSSAILISGNEKIAAYREQKTMVFGYDTSRTTARILWQRYDGGKMVSKWYESLSGRFLKSEKFRELMSKPGTIQWFFNLGDAADKGQSFLFISLYHRQNNRDIVVLLEISREELIRRFRVFSDYDDLRFLVKFDNGKIYRLKPGINEFFSPIAADSLSLAGIQNLQHFKDNDSVSFKFSYGEDIIWNLYKKYPDNQGFEYYLLSIPETTLMAGGAGRTTGYYFLWAGAVLVVVTIVLWLIRARRRTANYGEEMESLSELLANDENRFLEFKSSLRWDYRQEKVNPALEQVVLKTIAAFGNTEGGILLIGVDDEKNILGLEKDFSSLKKPNADGFELHLRNLLHTQFGVRYVSENIRIRFESRDGKQVCKIQVLKARKPAYLTVKDKNGNSREKFFVRSGNSSQEISNLSEINEYINHRFED